MNTQPQYFNKLINRVQRSSSLDSEEEGERAFNSRFSMKRSQSLEIRRSRDESLFVKRSGSLNHYKSMEFHSKD